MSMYGSADTQERRIAAGALTPPAPPKRAPYVPSTTPVLLNDGRKIFQTYEWVLEYNTSKDLPFFRQYPALYEALVNQTVAQKAPLTSSQMAELARRNGVPVDVLITQMRRGAGGGGTGANRANEIKALAALISDEASKLGLSIGADQIAVVATLAQKEGWTSAQIIDDLTKTVNFGSLGEGSLKTNIAEFKTLGTNYLVNISDATAQNWALKIARGETTAETVINSIKEQAKAANPWLAQFIDKGIDPVDALAGNRDFIAKNLEIDSVSLDLFDPKVLGMMTVTDANGTKRLADQSEMLRNVRRDDRWKNTNNAKELGAATAGMLGRIFGRSVY